MPRAPGDNAIPREDEAGALHRVASRFLTSPVYAVALGLVLFGLIKALVVIVAGRQVGLPTAAILPIAIAWAAGPACAGWVVKRWKDARRAATYDGNAAYAKGAQDAK